MGGTFYLLNKIFSAFGELCARREMKEAGRRWFIASWSIYLLGLLPWVIVFAEGHNWIAAGLEAAGGPSMAVGLINWIYHSDRKVPPWLNGLAAACMAAGILYSLYEFSGITLLTQWLELGMVIGFLAGTFLLAQKPRKNSGYLFYILMNAFCAWLMYEKDIIWMVYQQAVSSLFTFAAFLMALKKK